MRGVPSILSFFTTSQNKFNNTGVRKSDSIYQMTLTLSDRSLLMKMLITLEPNPIFSSNFAYLLFEIGRENDKVKIKI